MTSASHPCDACGGTGCTSAYYDGHTHLVTGCFCPVCLGAGRLPDRMPVADAVADAETLRANSQNLDDAINQCWLLLRVRESAEMIACHIEYGETEWAGDEARNAARAAFRAVPGLREE